MTVTMLVATIKIVDNKGTNKEVLLQIPLDATVMHDNMLNVQRIVDQAVYNLFKDYQK